jgi:hypothetical protein
MIILIILVAITNSTLVLAQSASGSFNPQIQFSQDSRLMIRSVYGIAASRPQGGYGQSHSWNQSQQNLPTYNASVTLDIQVSGEMSGGGIQVTIQGGVIVVDASTIPIIGGAGQISGIDRITMEGTGASTSGQSVNWRMNGLAALVNGSLIAELTGDLPLSENGATTNVFVTYIATIS